MKHDHMFDNMKHLMIIFSLFSYELPDSHQLLEGVSPVLLDNKHASWYKVLSLILFLNLQMDKREPDDPCPYLLAIWTPGMK